MNPMTDLEAFIEHQRQLQAESNQYVQELFKDIDIKALMSVDLTQMDEATRQELFLKHGIQVDVPPKKRGASEFRQKTRALAC